MHRRPHTIRTVALYMVTVLVATSYPLTTMAESTDQAMGSSTTTTTPVAATSTGTSGASEPIIVTPQSPSSVTSTSSQSQSDPVSPAPSPSQDLTQSTPPTTTAPLAVTSDPAAAVDNAKSTTSAEDPTPSVATTAPATSTVDAATQSAIANSLDSSASSGSATVTNNSTTGNTSTGNAAATTTIVNQVNSSLTNANNQQAASFVQNVTGDVSGDIILQPLLLKAMLENQAPASTTASSATGVTNTVNLQAASGGATVQGNTQTGDVSTGNANTVADVMNIVNSMVGSQQSFVGTVNIYGNLNGDILVAPDFIPQLLASNAAAPSLTSSQTTPTSITTSDTQSIVNNVALAAKSGQALVSGNTTVGDISSGNAKTNIVLFNLSGHQIVASNSLLVFVNVLGKWVGVIVDAPQGATAAAIGNNVNSDTTSQPSITMNSTNNTVITNNLTLSSRSGDATVQNNTTTGSVRTGNATASANIANLVGDHISLAGWFGILFINVFGSWNGSFGVDTSAGNPTEVPGSSQSGAGMVGALAQPVIQFRPHAASTSGGASIVSPTVPSSAPVMPTSVDTSQVASEGGTLVSSPVTAPTKVTLPKAQKPTNNDIGFNALIVAGATVITGIGALGVKRYF